jgi:hypothetical protein
MTTQPTSGSPTLPIAALLAESLAASATETTSPSWGLLAPGCADLPVAPVNPAASTSTPPLECTDPSLATMDLALSEIHKPLAPARPRNGKIAQLPKPERDLVNSMLASGRPYRLIVQILAEAGFRVSERNLSSWKTHGGFNAWCEIRRRALSLRYFQDNLTDCLRRHDAADVPEVGLQAVATSISAFLLRPDLMRQLLADPDRYTRLIELQCRLTREIQALQKTRNLQDQTPRS